MLAVSCTRGASPIAAPTTGASNSLVSAPCHPTTDTINAPVPTGSRFASSIQANGVVPAVVAITVGGGRGLLLGGADWWPGGVKGGLLLLPGGVDDGPLPGGGSAVAGPTD